MNTLKNVLFFGLLLAVLCGVYLSLKNSPETPLPPGLSGDTTPVKIEPGQMVPPVTNVSASTVPNAPPNFPSQPPSISASSGNTGDMAPPFRPTNVVVPSNPGAPPPFGGDQSTMPAPPGSMSVPPPPAPPQGLNYPPGVSDPSLTGTATMAPPFASTSAARPPMEEHATSASADHSPSNRLDLIMQQVDLKVNEKRIADALLILSQLYGSPDLPASQAQVVTKLLDQMAATVIYSRQHLLESAYLVQAGDTLDSIADRYQVPALLLARINGIRDPQNLPPGKELKVLKGPFSAQVSTDRSEMTLMLDARYAGRFTIVLSDDLSHVTGMWTVRDKRAPTSASGSGAGTCWIELGSASGNISMQGPNDMQGTIPRNSRSTIWLSAQDMDDVFGILSVGSRVIIQR